MTTSSSQAEPSRGKRTATTLEPVGCSSGECNSATSEQAVLVGYERGSKKWATARVHLECTSTSSIVVAFGKR